MSFEGFVKYKLGDIVDDIAMGPFGSNIKVENFISQGVPVIRGQNLNHGGFEDKNFVFISEEKAHSLKRSLAYPDDLVITHRGTIGQVSIIPYNKHPKYLVSQSQMKLTVNKEYLVPKYLLYFFKSRLGQYELLKDASQVGVPAIASPTKALKNVEIAIPDQLTQKGIVSILSTLDDKIELNNRMNKVLEQMAQAVFKQWFVDFEFPNENGDPYKSSGGVMEWCEELGKEIPKGWPVTQVSNSIDINPKRILKKGTESTYLEMKNLPTFSARATDWIRREFTSGSKYINGDVLMARITPCLENGKTIYVDFLENDEVGWGSTEFIVLRSKNNKALGYAYFLARSEEFREHSISNMSGSSGRQRVPESCYDHYKIPTPPNDILERFDEITSSVLLRIKRNGTEAKILSNLRDTLLPKLMSGEIDVSEVEL
ncbi:MAG: restriction endonuclease subunit S [Candidatus Cohnella colombiensis]|uniref:Restriction endonuclease subunit S n=1 Tax=Candidatus Cohnella colombiensis TaxID=3121368 RepID=A0AA95F483_9BACL|nr:MAG: restriction endonuclease subunit S [Cohnella sp.]